MHDVIHVEGGIDALPSFDRCVHDAVDTITFYTNDVIYIIVQNENSMYKLYL